VGGASVSNGTRPRRCAAYSLAIGAATPRVPLGDVGEVYWPRVIPEAEAEPRGGLDDADMYVLRRSDNKPSRAQQWLRLLSLDQFGVGLTVEWSEEVPGAAGDVFETLFEVRGRWQGPLAFALSADWVVPLDSDRVAFEESRRELFSLRVRHSDTFYAEYLLRRVNDHSQYAALGLYGNRAGLDQACNHPAIRKWERANPAAKCGAREATGWESFQIAGGGSIFGGRAVDYPAQA
jgi:hypothetical protein